MDVKVVVHVEPVFAVGWKRVACNEKGWHGVENYAGEGNIKICDENLGTFIR
jgi:hypothetical protein